MTPVGRFLRGFGQFWYDFVVGDDPKIAIGIATVLVVGAALAAADLVTGPVVVLLAALVAGSFVVAMVVDVRRSRRRG